MTHWTPDDLSGHGRPSPLFAEWPAPVDVRVDDEEVSWDRAATAGMGGRQHVDPKLLERFVALARSADLGSAVVDFVQDFGPLGVDADGQLLAAHDSNDLEQRRREVERMSVDRHGEPLTAYRQWSDKVAAVLPVVGALTTRRKPPTADLVRFARVVLGRKEEVYYRQLFGEGEPPKVDPVRSGTDTEVEKDLRAVELRPLIAGVVTSWLYYARIGFGIRWPETETDKPGQLAMVGGSAGCLPSVLLQLALTMTRAESAFTCSGCGLPFTPRRLPREGQRAFCGSCRAGGVPQKLATRALRARQRQEGESNG